MDIIGPFSPGKGQCKFLLVRIDYFSKWIKVEPLATITTRNVQNFVWRNIVCRFGIPHVIITDNGRQFIDRGLVEFYEKLNIKHITSSVELLDKSVTWFWRSTERIKIHLKHSINGIRDRYENSLQIIIMSNRIRVASLRNLLTLI